MPVYAEESDPAPAFIEAPPAAISHGSHSQRGGNVSAGRREVDFKQPILPQGPEEPALDREFGMKRLDEQDS